MPVQSFGHSAFWSKDSAGAPPPPVSGTSSGYASCQAGAFGGVCVASLFGAIQPQWGRLIQAVRWWGSFIRRIVCLNGESRAVLLKVLDLIERPEYRHARSAVAETAVTLGFNRPEAWKPYSHMLKADHRRAENLFRHVRACERVKELMLVAAPINNPDLNLLTELAYQGFCWRNR